MFLCLTMDSDWAPPAVLDYALALLRPSAVPYTFFLTEGTQAPELGATCEIALHPFFADRDPAEVLRSLCSQHPQARGLRPHRLMMPEARCAAAVRASGVRWVSSHADPQARNLKRWAADIPDAPIFWGDNSLFRNSERPALHEVDANAPGLLVFNFHPVHLFLNTCSLEQYEKAKPMYHDAQRLWPLRNTTRYGVRDALLDLLAHPGHMPFVTLSHAVEMLA